MDYFTFHEVPLLYRDKRLIQSWTNANTSPCRVASAATFPFDHACAVKRETTLLYHLCCLYEYIYLFSVSIFIQVFLIDGVFYWGSPNGRHICYTAGEYERNSLFLLYIQSIHFEWKGEVVFPKRYHRWTSNCNRLHKTILFVIHLLWLHLGTFRK